jgi:PRTRC genetic system protein E
VLITVSKLDGEQLQVNICPRQLKVGENEALTIPLSVTGTAADLDAELVTQISSFVASHVGLNTNLAAVEKEIAEAEKAAREAAAKKKQKVAGSGGKKTVDNAPVEQLSGSPQGDPNPAQPLNLFDDQPEAVAASPAATA